MSTRWEQKGISTRVGAGLGPFIASAKTGGCWRWTAATGERDGFSLAAFPVLGRVSLERVVSSGLPVSSCGDDFINPSPLNDLPSPADEVIVPGSDRRK